ncbi:MAG TPA: transposase family protein [Bryobacteraceae bacterium]
MNGEQDHGEKRSWKQEQFIAALLSHPTVEAAAKAVGIGDTTAWRWRNDPAFAGRYREATREAMRHAAAILQGAAREAVDTLRAILSKGESEAARVSAARTILEMAFKAADVEDIQQRLDALEQAVEANERNPASGGL